MKRCRRCKAEKSLPEFVIDNRSSDGHGSRCKPCHSIVAAESAARRQNYQARPFVPKACITCGIVKDIDGYMPRKGMCDGMRNECRQCMSNRANVSRKRIEANLTAEQLLERRRAYRLRNVSMAARASRKQSLRGYGLTPETFETLLKTQADKCAICSTHLESPQIDHCHRTGKVRGILCRKCNMGLGLFGDDPATLQHAIAYLTQ